MARCYAQFPSRVSTRIARFTDVIKVNKRKSDSQYVASVLGSVRTVGDGDGDGDSVTAVDALVNAVNKDTSDLTVCSPFIYIGVAPTPE